MKKKISWWWAWWKKKKNPFGQKPSGTQAQVPSLNTTVSLRHAWFFPEKDHLGSWRSNELTKNMHNKFPWQYHLQVTNKFINSKLKRFKIIKLNLLTIFCFRINQIFSGWFFIVNVENTLLYSITHIKIDLKNSWFFEIFWCTSLLALQNFTKT